MQETRRLAQWVVDTDYADLPSEVVEAVRIYILDDLASGFAGAAQPWTDIVAGVALAASSGPCSLFGRSETTSSQYAALVNGVSIGGFEVDHAFAEGSAHPSGSVFPAVMALAEREHLDGRAFMTAVATGYEALCRVGLAATRAVEDERGFHGPGTNAPLGAAFGAAKALGLSLEATLNAVGIAGSHGSGLLEFFREGAMTKRLHLGRGAQLGLECVLLAQHGFTGPSTVLEGEMGFLRVYSPSPRPELLLEGLGQRYLLLGMTLKTYPCHLSFHAVVDAIARFRAQTPFEAAEIETVTITAAGRMMEERFADRAPTTMMGAQYSLPWSAALALTRDVAAPASWTERDLSDASVRRLAASMTLRDAAPVSAGAVAQIELRIRGREHVFDARGWKGARGDPYSFADMAAKFRRYAEGSLPATTIEELAERVSRIESETDTAKLLRLIRAR